MQCCGAENIFYGSGSELRIAALAPGSLEDTLKITSFDSVKLKGIKL
jgi:hypothetical protein